MTFRERYLSGQADFDEIFDLTDEWNFSDDSRTLREFLGLTVQEEDIWISESDEALEEFMEQERKRKIFFTDLDGTLLDDQKEITPGNRKALDTLLKDGHVVAISTGRALSSALLQARRLGLDGKNCFIICYNGSGIYDMEHNKMIYHQSIPMEYVRYVFDEAKKFGIAAQTYTDTAVITENDNPSFRKYVQIQGLEYHVTEDVTKMLSHEPPKILVLDYEDTERVNAFREYFTPLCQGKMDAFLSNPALLELVPLGINKGTAVEFLCTYLGIPLSNSVAAGDAENDLSMIKAAHVGAAMCNGVTLLKEQADYITTLDNNHDGVAEIIEKFIL